MFFRGGYRRSEPTVAGGGSGRGEQQPQEQRRWGRAKQRRRKKEVAHACGHIHRNSGGDVRGSAHNKRGPQTQGTGWLDAESSSTTPRRGIAVPRTTKRACAASIQPEIYADHGLCMRALLANPTKNGRVCALPAGARNPPTHHPQPTTIDAHSETGAPSDNRGAQLSPPLSRMCAHDPAQPPQWPGRAGQGRTGVRC